MIATEHAFHASARFGFNARPGELAYIASDPQGWVLEQIQRPQAFPNGLTSSDTGAALLHQKFMARKKKRQEAKQRALQAVNKEINRHFRLTTGERLIAQAQTAQPFTERMVLFWCNHFTVSRQKGIITPIIHQFEHEAIRPHLGGYFSDMLLAVEQHPVMLYYLDNTSSFGPNSKAGKRHQRGLNENLAREILELHTLGVDGGYSQDDVIALAKIITGWGFDRPGLKNGLRFHFKQARHEPGDKVLLGYRIKESGLQEGQEAMKLLAHHPSTARFIAYKLVRHFIADEPADADVSRIASVFLESLGHLPTVLNAVIALPSAWERPLNKFKNPYEFLTSAIRVSDIDLSSQQAYHHLMALRYPVKMAPSPAGFDDRATAWSAPDAIMKRVKMAHRLARRAPMPPDPLAFADQILGPIMREETAQVIRSAESAQDALAYLLASPEFQRR